MECKLIEVRDSGTFIPMLAVKLDPRCSGSDFFADVCDRCRRNRWLLSRAGYGASENEQGLYVLLVEINGGSGRSNCDPYDWPTGARTITVAHRYILDHWCEIETGAVVDVEHILGISPGVKRSEEQTIGGN